jgi:tellurite resistance-related uncharacterized protein
MLFRYKYIDDGTSENSPAAFIKSHLLSWGEYLSLSYLTGKVELQQIQLYRVTVKWF